MNLSHRLGLGVWDVESSSSSDLVRGATFGERSDRWASLERKQYLVVRNALSELMCCVVFDAVGSRGTTASRLVTELRGQRWSAAFHFLLWRRSDEDRASLGKRCASHFLSIPSSRTRQPPSSRHDSATAAQAHRWLRVPFLGHLLSAPPSSPLGTTSRPHEQTPPQAPSPALVPSGLCELERARTRRSTSDDLGVEGQSRTP